MTKEKFQQELKEKVKEGVKPSHLKKLKRSKSADDIPSTPKPQPLERSQSQLEFPLTQPNSKQQIIQLEEQVKFHSQTAANYLTSLSVIQAKVSELEEKLKNKPLNSEELDQSLIARHKSLKDWWKQYSKSKELDKELSENVEEASEELIKQDNLISSLRSEKRSLKRDLQLAQRLAESRKVPYYSPEDKGTYLKYALYSLLAVGFTLWLTNSLKNIRESPYD